ncbi:MAG: hypothetical protein LLG04_03495 [Parachlamydia sp.]|nr:hypothetical protein [Parachlamydia sp.]
MVNAVNHAISFPASYDLKQRQEIAGKLQRGDVIFTKYRGSFSLTAAHKPSSIITFFQAIANKLSGKKDKDEFYRMTHAVVVVEVDKASGNVLIAESLPLIKDRNQLRVADLFSDPYLKLGPKDPWQYQVFRMHSSKAGKIPTQAADIAESLATRERYLPKSSILTNAIRGSHAYSFIKGLLSLFGKMRDRVGTERYAKRLFKQVADEYLRQTEHRSKATGGKRDRAFYCSYFAAHVFQQAEIYQKIEQIEKMDGVKQGLARIKAIKEGPARTTELRKWSKDMGKRHRSEISQLIQSFNLDPKHSSPKELIRFLKKKNLFQEILVMAPRP